MVRQPRVETDLVPNRRTVFHLFEDYLDGGYPSIANYICPTPEWVSNVDPRPGVVLDTVISTPEPAGPDESLLDRLRSPREILAALYRLYVADPEAVLKEAPGLDQILGQGVDLNTTSYILAKIDTQLVEEQNLLQEARPCASSMNPSMLSA